MTQEYLTETCVNCKRGRGRLSDTPICMDCIREPVTSKGFSRWESIDIPDIPTAPVEKFTEYGG